MVSHNGGHGGAQHMSDLDPSRPGMEWMWGEAWRLISIRAIQDMKCGAARETYSTPKGKILFDDYPHGVPNADFDARFPISFVDRLAKCGL